MNLPILKSRTRRLPAGLALSTVLLLLAPLSAQTYVWESAVDGDWLETDKWNPNGVPDGAGIEARLNATGATHTVTSYTDVLLQALGLESADVIFQQYGTLEVAELSLVAGEYHLFGTLRGAQVVANGASGLLANGGRLSGISLSGANALTIADISSLSVDGGLSLAGTHVRFGGADGTGSSYLSFDGESDQVVSGTGTIDLGSSGSSWLYNYTLSYDETLGYDSHQVTFGSGVTVQGAGTIHGNPSGYAGGSILNQGVIQATENGKILFVSGNITNESLLTAKDGGILNVNGSLVNEGQVSVQDGSVVQLAGAVTQSATGVTAHNSTGRIELAGGTLSGGTVGSVEGRGVVVPAGNIGNLGSVTLAGERAVMVGDVDNFAYLSIVGEGDQTISGTGTIDLGSHGGSWLYNYTQSYDETLGYGSHQVTLGSGVTVQGAGAIHGNAFGYAGGSILNQGVIQATENGKILLLSDKIINDNLLTAKDGGVLQIGTITQTAAGVIAHDGTGRIELGGGILTGGTVGKSDGYGVGVSANHVGSLGSVALAGERAVVLGDADNPAYLSIVGEGDQTFSGTGTIDLGSHGGSWLYNYTLSYDETLGYDSHQVTFGSGVTVQGAGTIHGNAYGYAGGSILNQGTLRANVAGGSLFVYNLANLAGGTLTDGTYRAETGAALVFNDGPVQTNAATLELHGAGSIIQGAGSTLEQTLQQNAGTLRITGGRGFTAENALTNSGTVELGGGTLDAPSLANAATGEIYGFGSIAVRPTNSGTIRAVGGTLAFANGIQGGSGTVQVDPDSTLDLSGGSSNSSADHLIHHSTTPGSLNLGSNNFLVGVDYTNANFGVGNDFAPRANVSGSGQILAEGDVTQAVTGATLTGGTTAAPTLAFGNVHVGDTVTENYRVNNAGTTGPSLRGAVQTAVNGGNLTDARLSGTGVTASNFGPVAPGAETGDLAVTFNATTAGALTGQAVHLRNNFDNVAEQTLSITGAAYRYASPTAHTPEPVALGNFHVGDAAPSQTLSLTNDVPNDGFSEALNASIGSATGGVTTNGGSFSLLAPGATNSGALAVGIDTSTAGSKNGTATITLVSDGAGSSGLGQTALAPQTVNVTGAVFRYAQPSAHTPEPVSFGIVHVGEVVASQAVTIANTAAADGYSETLNAVFTGVTTGLTTSGSVTQLAPGSTDSTSLQVGLVTTTAGAISGTATLALTSDGTGSSGLGLTTLAPQTVNVNGQVNYYAEAALTHEGGGGVLSGSATAYTVDFGEWVSGSGVILFDLGIGNTLFDPDFQDTLGGSFDLAGLTDFSVTGAGSFTGLAAGASPVLLSLSLDSDALAPGVYSQSFRFDPLSENAGSITGLGSIDITLTATIASVPEPAAGMLLMVSVAGLLGRRRRD